MLMALESQMNSQNICDSIVIATYFARANPDAIDGSDVSRLVMRLVKNFTNLSEVDYLWHEIVRLLKWAKQAEAPSKVHTLIWEGLIEKREKKYERMLTEKIHALAMINKKYPLYYYGGIVVNALHAYAKGGGHTQSFVVYGSSKFIEIAGAQEKKIKKREPKPLETGEKIDLEIVENDENDCIFDIEL